MGYKAVIFDLFGTLVDNFSVQEHERVLSEMAAALSVPAEEFIRLWTGETLDMRMRGFFPTVDGNIEHICRALGVQADAGNVAEASRIRFEFTRRTLKPRPDALATLAQLKSAGCKAGLITDCSREVPLLWPDTPFAPLVEVTVFSCDVGFRKPDPRTYLLACERLQVEPRECLYVGDGSSRELTGASQVGMHPVLIRVPYEDTYDAYRFDPEEWQGATISALKDILTLVP